VAYFQTFEVDVQTAADGSATVFSPNMNGYIHQISYVKTDFADGVDVAVTVESTGQSVWTEANVNASATRAPRQPTHNAGDGSAALYAAAGSPVNDRIAVAAERLQIAVANGGNGKSGKFLITVGG
jgi:hypothetical protein